MTALCGGGASAPKPGVVTNNIVAGSLITEGLALITPWLIPFAAYIDAFLYNATSQCVTDPPAMPTSAQLSPVNAIGGVFNPNFTSWLSAVNNLLLNYFWSVFCQCTTAAPPNFVYPPLPANTAVPAPRTGLTYQQVKSTHGALAAWALVESSGTDFAPYISAQHMTLSGVADYQQAGPFPTSFGLNLHAGAKIGFTFSATVFPPLTRECWFKLPSATPAVLQQLMYSGNANANGSGVYVATNGHIHLLHGGVSDSDTLVLWPDTNWHLVELAANANGVTETLYIDGQVVYRNTLPAASAPSPNQLNFGADSSAGSANAILVALPAIYALELTPVDTNAEFGAAQSSGIQGQGAGGAGAASDTELISLVTAIYKWIIPPLATLVESTVHPNLTGSGSIIFGSSAVALKVVITTDNPQLRTSPGNPPFLFNRGYIVPLAAEGPIRQQVRLTYNPQLFVLPAQADGVGFTLTAGITISITELVRG